jgi:excisionase family DNA binding protein
MPQDTNERGETMIDYMTSKEAARKLGCKERYIRKLCSDGRIPGAVKMGGSWFVPKSSTIKVQRRDNPDWYAARGKR